MSELVLGRRGWAMVLAFLVWAAAAPALGAVFWSAGFRGLALLMAVLAFGLLGLGWFPTEPIMARPEERTRAGKLHVAFAIIVIPAFRRSP